MNHQNIMWRLETEKRTRRPAGNAIHQNMYSRQDIVSLTTTESTNEILLVGQTFSQIFQQHVRSHAETNSNDLSGGKLFLDFFHNRGQFFGSPWKQTLFCAINGHKHGNGPNKRKSSQNYLQLNLSTKA